MDKAISFGEQLRSLRREQHISQRDLASMVGVDHTYISKIESGQMPPPSKETIHRLAVALGTDEGQLAKLAGKVSTEVLAQHLATLESTYVSFGEELEELRRLVETVRREQVKEGPLAPLAKALVYHHQMENKWVALALHVQEGKELNPDEYHQLAIEFVRMRDVLVHYEYVAQILLGINPSPFADLEEGEQHNNAR